MTSLPEWKFVDPDGLVEDLYELPRRDPLRIALLSWLADILDNPTRVERDEETTPGIFISYYEPLFIYWTLDLGLHEVALIAIEDERSVTP
jgi:hypothetical protein